MKDPDLSLKCACNPCRAVDDRFIDCPFTGFGARCVVNFQVVSRPFCMTRNVCYIGKYLIN